MGAGGGATDGPALAFAADSTSRRVIAPPGPVPFRTAGSTPSSKATRIASGEIRKRPARSGRRLRDTARRRRRSSSDRPSSGPLWRRRGSGSRWWWRSSGPRWRRWRSGPRGRRGYGLRLGRRRRFAVGGDHRHDGADRDLFALLHHQALQDAVLEHLDFDRAFFGLDDGDDIAALDRVAGFDQPLDQRAGLHVDAQRWHPEFSHGCPPGRARFRRSPAPAGAPLPPDAWDMASALRRCIRAPPARRVRKTPLP